MRKPLYMKITLSSFAENSRDARELSTASKAGWDYLHVIAPLGFSDLHSKPIWSCTEIDLRPFGNKGIKKIFGNIVAFFKFIKYARKKQPRVISGHDLLGLLIGYLATLGRRKKCVLIYDAHEYEMGRFVGDERNIFHKKAISIIERFLIKKCVFSIIVNDSIAKQMEKDYKLNFPKVIARNIPIQRSLDLELTKAVRRNWIKKLNISEDSMIMMYHGGLQAKRGIETSIEICSRITDIGLVILGNGSPEYISELKSLVNSKGICDRVLFNEAVPGSLLTSYIAASDFGLILIKPVSLNHRFSLPNKLFENIHAGKPVIASHLPELANVIEKYNIGILCDPNDMDDVETKVRKMLRSSLRTELSKNVLSAREVLTWENEEKELLLKLSQGYKEVYW